MRRNSESGSTHPRHSIVRSLVLASLVLTCVAVHAAAVDISANQIGRLTSVGNMQTRTFNEYDLQGRIVATQHEQDEHVRIFRTEFGYAQNPETTSGPGTVMISQTLPDGERVTYMYDAGGVQVVVRSALGSIVEDVVRDVRKNARGQVIRIELGNGTVTTRAYDDVPVPNDPTRPGNHALILTTTLNGAGEKIQEYGYSYDANLNVKGIVDGVVPGQSSTYTYDPLDQLTAIVNAFGSVLESYAYDAIGNLTQKGTLVQSYGVEGRPAALKDSGGIPYGYDANGNVITIGTATTLEWNAENMSRRVTAGSVVTEKSFLGEAVWKKVEQGVTTYYLPSMRVENGMARKYYGAYAERFEQPGDRQLRFYHPDPLGNTTVMTDQFGKPIRRASYLPWGQDRGVQPFFERPGGIVVPAFAPKLQFNFKERDATGFYDYGARIYNPLTGRWLSPDTAPEERLHRYTYVRNNPLTMTDPTGHWPTWVHDYILNQAFPHLDYRALRAMQAGSFATDFPETVLETEAHKHGMTPGYLVRQKRSFEAARSIAQEMASQWIINQMAKARSYAARDLRDLRAYYAFGEGMHTIMDAHSPPHRWSIYDLQPYTKFRRNGNYPHREFDFHQYMADMDAHKRQEERFPTRLELQIMVDHLRSQFGGVFGAAALHYAVFGRSRQPFMIGPKFYQSPIR
ncbi:MAG TPA: RHS repeat-associated core domain-containing protein [Thermoanaerobaculia bacterium]|nr:RHS repeat-associated core domain-containing protein [Thermoanaerobaculia bacterium]